MTQEGIISTTFQLTTSRRGRRHAQITICPPAYFNSLPHAEVDRLENCCFPRNQNFNSLPHAEVDSRHHGLWPSWRDFNSLPHAEVDPGWQSHGRTQSYFNSLPHAEVDISTTQSCMWRMISTHYLTQR